MPGADDMTVAIQPGARRARARRPRCAPAHRRRERPRCPRRRPAVPGAHRAVAGGRARCRWPPPGSRRRSRRCRARPSPAGSQTTPDGTPYMTTNASSAPPPGGDPGQPRARPGERRPGSPGRAIPSPYPASTRPASVSDRRIACRDPAAGSSAASCSEHRAEAGQEGVGRRRAQPGREVGERSSAETSGNTPRAEGMAYPRRRRCPTRSPTAPSSWTATCRPTRWRRSARARGSPWTRPRWSACQRNRETLERILSTGTPVYGISTGFGALWSPTRSRPSCSATCRSTCCAATPPAPAPTCAPEVVRGGDGGPAQRPAARPLRRPPAGDRARRRAAQRRLRPPGPAHRLAGRQRRSGPERPCVPAAARRGPVFDPGGRGSSAAPRRLAALGLDAAGSSRARRDWR